MRIAMPRGIWSRRMSLERLGDDVPNLRRYANRVVLPVMMMELIYLEESPRTWVYMGSAKGLHTMQHWVTDWQSPVSRVLLLENDIIQFSYM